MYSITGVTYVPVKLAISFDCIVKKIEKLSSIPVIADLTKLDYEGSAICYSKNSGLAYCLVE